MYIYINIYKFAYYVLIRIRYMYLSRQEDMKRGAERAAEAGRHVSWIIGTRVHVQI
jgi:hypothetical protein